MCIYINPLTIDDLAYTKTSMEIEFDPAKDAGNIAKHGVSLARAGDLDAISSLMIVPASTSHAIASTA